MVVGLSWLALHLMGKVTMYKFGGTGSEKEESETLDAESSYN